MLNRFYFLVSDPGVYSRQAALDADIVIAHVVDARAAAGGVGSYGGHDRPGSFPANGGHDGPGSFPANGGLLEQMYSDRGNYPFVLAIRDMGDDPAALRELLLFFFHPYYQWGDRGKPLIVFMPAAPRACFRRRMEEFLAQQGLQAELLLVYPGSGVRMLEMCDNDPAGEYYRYCVSEWSAEDVFLLPDSCPERVIEDLQAVTNDLRMEHPVFSRLASENTVIRKQLALLDRDNVRLKEENTILNELTELNSRHNEVDYILKFYKNEYEILPLWYKRFGHVIKVLQGKRSFRSLYDKKVKKYKD